MRKYKRDVALSYFGGKARLVNQGVYPPPKYQTIIEPFAGGAGYSYKYSQWQVHLIELNPMVAGVWRWLQRTDAVEWLLKLPETITRGCYIRDILPPNAPAGMDAVVAMVVFRGLGGLGGSDGDIINWKIGYGAVDYNYIPSRLNLIMTPPRIKHWKIEQGDYRTAPDVEATWFIDPPYQGKGGDLYTCGNKEIDYEELGEWCRSRKGQVIVCERGGADWLPFGLLTKNRNNMNDNYNEMIWYKEDER